MCLCTVRECFELVHNTVQESSAHAQVGGWTERVSGQRKGYIWCESGEENSSCTKLDLTEHNGHIQEDGLSNESQWINQKN